ncbi:MAG: LCP family protein [Actinomycetota bacterium]|jgi:hypothetical protein|nr:LCP family protein [Actinomycetota bacterium]
MAVRTAWRGHAGWVLPLVVLVASVVGLYVLASDRFDGGGAAADPSVDGLPSAIAAGPASLVVQLDEGGAAVAFTLLTLDGEQGGTTVLLPASTMVEIPGFGLDKLSRAVELGGVQLAELSLRNLLSIDLEHVAVLSPDDWTDLGRTLDRVEVDNPARLDAVDVNGRVEVLWPRGQVDVEAVDMASFLAGRAIGETDLERLVRHQRFWTAYLDARLDIVGVVVDPYHDFESFLDEAAVRSSELDYRILPVETLGGPAELYRVDAGGLSDLIAIIAPEQASASTARVRLQLLNGVGTPGLAEPVTALLLPTGAVVQLTGNALEFDHDVTQIVYYRDEHVASALRIRDELGLGEVVKQRDPIDVVDITVVIGRDLAAQLDG